MQPSSRRHPNPWRWSEPRRSWPKALPRRSDANEAETLAHDATTPWERYFLAYDPAPTLARVTVPVLALNGSLDVQVPAKENLEADREALKNNAAARVIELPNMNHLLQDAKTGAPTEYNDIDETMSPVALKIITDWVRQQASFNRAGGKQPRSL
jgi:pimeloyl-ACP methyl ester carboxylesterase